jgi:hypothetical protein
VLLSVHAWVAAVIACLIAVSIVSIAVKDPQSFWRGLWARLRARN